MKRQPKAIELSLDRPTEDQGVATTPPAPATLEAGGAHATGEKQVVRLEANGAARPRRSKPITMKEIHEMEQRKVSEHYAAPIDAAWAKRATPALQSDLMKIAEEKGFRLKGVNCRNETCIAEVEWPTYDAALQNYTDLATSNLEVNCARTVVLPDPSDKAAPLTARVILDCQRWKVEGSQFLSALSNRTDNPQPQAAAQR